MEREKVQPCVRVAGPIIVGGGPSGLATAACLAARGFPSLVLERSNCIASLWQLKSYDRLRLHLPKRYCELPMMPFPAALPAYPSKEEFVAYLESYAAAFGVCPVLGEAVESAEYDEASTLWRVSTSSAEGNREYVSRWLVAATGENAEEVIPEIGGLSDFQGTVAHTSRYRSGEEYRGKKVLVVGCGNSGMEVCLDLCDSGARPAIVVRDTVHVLPRGALGWSTFGLSMWLLRWLPVQAVDRLLLLLARLLLGDTAHLGLRRPKVGPLELKAASGKTPILDIGTLSKIKSGHVQKQCCVGLQVFPALKRMTAKGAEFVDGRTEEFDAVILATGYRSNVPSWLKERVFSERDGLPRRPFPNGWKGERGLYAVGFTKRGLLGASLDAQRVAQDIERCWNSEIGQ
ncbi:hypothetical protein HPP92_002906 [Vanilla planifolia]|uniref:indole-3-pyruvate monooxygenase n=1 Tax=Vanilla planifolia TaxID=51239 RepID=A0A835RTE6_VANPL|nr:hypothetical protein HPP92_002906 [Vanilla planifolia]